MEIPWWNHGGSFGRFPACYRCHSQKLRCIYARGNIACERCNRAAAPCLPRPSKRNRQRNSNSNAKNAAPEDRSPSIFSVPTENLNYSLIDDLPESTGFAEVYSPFELAATSDVNHEMTAALEQSYCSPANVFDCDTDSSHKSLDEALQQCEQSKVASLHETNDSTANQNTCPHLDVRSPGYVLTNDWIGALISLNTNLDESRKPLIEFIARCQKVDNARFADQTSPLEQTMSVAIALLKVCDIIQSEGEGGCKERTADGTAPNATLVRETELGAGTLHLELGATANELLLLSCHIRFLQGFCTVLECFQNMLASVNRSNCSMEDALARLVHLLPHPRVGAIPLDASYKLQIATFLGSVEALVNELHDKVLTSLHGLTSSCVLTRNQEQNTLRSYVRGEHSSKEVLEQVRDRILAILTALRSALTS